MFVVHLCGHNVCEMKDTKSVASSPCNPHSGAERTFNQPAICSTRYVFFVSSISPTQEFRFVTTSTHSSLLCVAFTLQQCMSLSVSDDHIYIYIYIYIYALHYEKIAKLGFAQWWLHGNPLSSTIDLKSKWWQLIKKKMMFNLWYI